MMSKSRIPSPSRSQGAPVTPRRSKPRRTLSVTSAKSDASGRLTSVVEQYIKDDKFKISPLRRKSVLPDDTDIEAPRRASWWKRLDGSSRDVLEALDTNRMPDELPLDDYEIEVQKDKQNHSVPESSDNESVASIIVPQRRLFNQKKQSQGKFGDIMASRKSLGKTNLDDQDKTIHSVPKNLFKQGQQKNRPVFPAALLNSTNKTINKTEDPEPESNTQGRNLFGQAKTKRKKNMFTDFVLSESEDDSEVQHKVFGFKNNDNKRMRLATRNRRMPSLTPSVTTDIDIDDWNLLPSSTMIGNGSIAMEVSRVITDKDIELAQDEDQDVTLTKPNKSLKVLSNKQNASKTKQSLRHSTLSKSKKQSDVYDKTHDKVSETKTVEQAQEDDQDAALTEANESLKPGQKDEEDIENDQEDDENVDLVYDVSDQVTPTKDVPKKSQKIVESSAEKAQIGQENKAVDATPNATYDTTGRNRIKDATQVKSPKSTLKNMSLKPISRSSVTEPNQSLEVESNNQNASKNKQSLRHSTLSRSKKQSDVYNKTHDKVSETKTAEQAQEDDQDAAITEANDSLKPGQKDEEDIENDQEDDDTTGRNKIKDLTQVKSPESVLKNMSRDNMSFKPIGRSTSFRRSTSPNENIISRPTLIPIQESIIGSDGSRNSSTEGSGWDSHRTTRKTLRQTFGKDFTPRMSLRALVMEKSAKRQTDVSKNTSKINKTRNKTVFEEAGKSATKVKETTNKTVLEDIRDRRVSNRNLSSDQLPSSKSPAPGVSALHVSDPNISKPQISYHKSILEINELGTSLQISNRQEPDQVIDDSGPEISIHASYGHGMSGDASDQNDDRSSVKNRPTNSEQKKSVIESMPLETDHDMHEALDYDPSLQEETTHEESSKEIPELENSDQQSSALDAPETEAQDVSNHEEEKEDSELEESEQDVEGEESNQEEELEPEVEIEESEQEESQKVSEPASEREESEEERESEQEEQEQSQQEIEPESEREDHEDSEQEIESEDEEQDDSQQEIEEVSEREQSHESVNDNSQQYSDQESDREMDSDNKQDDGISDNDHEDADEVERQQNSKRFTERVVFDNEISDQEIDYDLSERVSRQMTHHEISEQVSDVEMEDQSISRGSMQDTHDVSLGTKKSLLLKQMQKIAQENMELRQKIREKVANSLKRKRDCNPLMSPMQPKMFSTIRRMNKPEPKKPKIKPRKTTTITIGTLPKEFLDDLKYKPPKRFQPANAPWITKRLYKFLEAKLEPKYDYRARIRAEELVQSIYGFTKLARRRDVAPQDAVEELKREMARLNVVTTHFDFYEFFHEFMPREIRIKVNPDIVNKIPMPRNGIFADILQSRPVVEG